MRQETANHPTPEDVHIQDVLECFRHSACSQEGLCLSLKKRPFKKSLKMDFGPALFLSMGKVGVHKIQE